MHIYGIDLVHLGDGRSVVLEDNLRIPSGISYQLKALGLVSQHIPEIASGYDIVPFDIGQTYHNLFPSLCDTDSPVSVILTDGKFGSALFEHRYLSELLGVPLVEGGDLYVGHDGRVYARTIDGDIPVDVIYRRVEDLDMFVPGLRDVYLDHKVVLVNGIGIGTGADDDKLVFLWVPEMVERATSAKSRCWSRPSYNLQDPENRRYVVENLDGLLIKARQGYGGLGVFVMPDLGTTYSRGSLRIFWKTRTRLSRKRPWISRIIWSSTNRPGSLNPAMLTSESSRRRRNRISRRVEPGRIGGWANHKQLVWWPMQTDVGGTVDS